MARKVLDVPITAEGRDKGKLFRITEMPAAISEKWAARAWLAVCAGDVEIPDEAVGTGWAGLAILSLKKLASAKWGDLEPLLDEMMQCVKIVRDPRHPELEFALGPDDVEEVDTRIKLRGDVFNLHAGPFIEGVRSKLGLAATTPAA